MGLSELAVPDESGVPDEMPRLRCESALSTCVTTKTRHFHRLGQLSECARVAKDGAEHTARRNGW